jgi:hypothetical protein
VEMHFNARNNADRITRIKIALYEIATLRHKHFLFAYL